MKVRKIIKNQIRCKKCGDIIESKSVHNFVTCSCGACACDGGHDYLRRVGNKEDWEELSESLEEEILPKYKRGDKVKFSFRDKKDIVGIIEVVDIFPYSFRVEYDIFSEDGSCLYKHMYEEDISEKVE